MDTCPECGNSDLSVVLVGGVAIVECGLCGERFGQRRVLESLSDHEEAERQGLAPEVWPLVRVLQRLPGIACERASAGDAAAGLAPAVTVALSGARGLDQVANLARMLRLIAGALRLSWMLEVEAERQLVFVLRPRPAAGSAGEALRDARLDLDTLARELDRNRKLQWWQRESVGR